jgi:hypothetical protein
MDQIVSVRNINKKGLGRPGVCCIDSASLTGRAKSQSTSLAQATLAVKQLDLYPDWKAQML